MERFVSSVEISLRTANWHSALAMSLMLPDICGRLEGTGESSKARYLRWWTDFQLSNYVVEVGAEGRKHTFLSSADAYALRCAFVHEGSDVIAEQKARDALTRFVFMEPPMWAGQGCHKNQIGTVLQLQVDIFCGDLITGVRRWQAKHAGSETVRANTSALIGIQPFGAFRA